MRLAGTASIIEVGPRDGLQFEKNMLSAEQKIELIERVADAGARFIEIGSFVRPSAVPQLADTDEVARRIRRTEGVEYSALVMNRKGVERAVAAGLSKVKFNVSASETHSQKNQNRSPEEAVASLEESIAYAKEHGIHVGAGISMAFGCPLDGSIPFARLDDMVRHLLALGVREIAPADTSGMADPLTVHDTMSKLLRKYPEAHFGIHLHNTRGLALTNTLAALLAGVSQHAASFAGLGGCPFAPGASGNVATEDVVHMLHAMGVQTGIDLEKILDVAQTAQSWLGRIADSSMLRVRRSKDMPQC